MCTLYFSMPPVQSVTALVLALVLAILKSSPWFVLSLGMNRSLENQVNQLCISSLVLQADQCTVYR